MKNTALHQGLNRGNSSDLLTLWHGLPAPRSIITSPPYLDMHDYGDPAQIGARGQRLEDYFAQMGTLFRDCYSITTDDATFWLVAGAVRRNNRLIPLPDKLARCAEEAGWILRESITWDKQKSLPWTHHGELRDITEQVLLFSKGSNFIFDATDLRSPIPNSIWWRRYPERYSPDGSMPTNLWSIPIPTQGAWSRSRTHFCPFPEELTYRMVSLTTEPSDVLLDPLAGVGSVPAMAQALGRIGYGIELVSEYHQLYDRTLSSAEAFVSHTGRDVRRRQIFRRTIIELRLLKFARLLAREVADARLPIAWVRVMEKERAPSSHHHVVSANFYLGMYGESCPESVLHVAHAAVARAPLSKFGIDAKISLTGSNERLTGQYWYSSGRFWDQPEVDQPVDGSPHVVASFRPNPDLVDDTPYV